MICDDVPVVAVRDLTQRYGAVTALDGVSIDIPQSRLVGDWAGRGGKIVFAGDSLTSKNYVPRLGDFMNTMQMRHIKLWFSGRAANWPLAEYELEQMLEAFQDIAFLYSGITVADMVCLMQPANEIQSAIADNNVSDFSKAFGKHDRGVQRVSPGNRKSLYRHSGSTTSPFSNQVFPSK